MRLFDPGTRFSRKPQKPFGTVKPYLISLYSGKAFEHAIHYQLISIGEIIGEYRALFFGLHPCSREQDVCYETNFTERNVV